MSDYEITIRARNARILRLIRAQGFETVAAFCRIRRLSYIMTNQLITSRIPAIADDKWTPHALRLAAALGVQVDTLFTARQALGGIKSVTREASEEQLIALTEATPDIALLEKSPEDAAADSERNKILDAAINELTPRQQQVIRARFGIDGAEMKRDEIGEIHGISAVRASQIEMKALRKLRESGRLRTGTLRPLNPEG